MKESTIKKMEEQEKKDFSFRLNETGEYRDTWKIFRIMAEFVEGYQFLSGLKKEVTVLGSARLPKTDPHCKIAKTLGALLGEKGYTTITGGGPGIMEAANHGAHESGGESVGLNIQLPFEQRTNPYVKKSTAFYYFFTRKVMLTSPAHAFVFFPGGFGTLDEFFEVIDHIELGKMCEVPVIMIGRDFWEPIVAFLKENCCQVGSLREKQMELWRIVDSAEEAVDIIENTDPGSYKECELSPMNFHSGTENVDWRIFRIMAELVEGFELLTGLVEDVTVLGTKSMDREHHYYHAAYELGKKLAKSGHAVVTGGATGIAEAANKGALEMGGESYGIGMEVRGKSRINQYVNKSITFRFPFTRKLIVTAPSKGFVFFPGGFGTLHQFFEVLTLIQTEKMQKIPIILYDSAFWKPIETIITDMLAKKFKTISKKDAELFKIVDDVDDILNIVTTFRNKQ
jgi:hypothetical protein